MAFTRSLGINLKEGSTTLESSSVSSITADAKSDFQQAIAGTTANQHFVFTIRTQGGKLKQLYITTDIDLSIFTNHASGSTPDDTLVLKAGVAIDYQDATGKVNPFAALDVASIYVTPVGATAGTLKIYTLQDPT